MAIYIMIEHHTGHCRMERVPPRLTQEELDAINARVKAMRPHYRAVKFVRDVTEQLEAGPAFYTGHRRGENMEELPDGYSGGSRSSRFL